MYGVEEVAAALTWISLRKTVAELMKAEQPSNWSSTGPARVGSPRKDAELPSRGPERVN